MSAINKIKQFALANIPGVRSLRDLRRALLDYRVIKPRFDELAATVKQWEIVLAGAGINNAPLYFEVIYKRFDLHSSLLKFSKAQLDQDLFVVYALQGKTDGFFVEFGATNGIDLSNTWLLESQFKWQGILAEPGKSWHEDLKRNRSCKIDTKCVYSRSGEKISFADSVHPELSTIHNFVDCDAHRVIRENPEHYEVETIALNDLLEVHGAPREIDYLSIDTEGSELEILRAFDFSCHHIAIITVEHNYTKNREKLYDLLSRNGFKRVFEEYSQFDDWYVNQNKLGKVV